MGHGTAVSLLLSGSCGIADLETDRDQREGPSDTPHFTVGHLIGAEDHLMGLRHATSL